MTVIFDNKTEFEVEKADERFQFMQYYFWFKTKVLKDNSLEQIINNFYNNHLNGIINKIELYENNELIDTINRNYKVDSFEKVYDPSTPNLVFIIISFKEII